MKILHINTVDTVGGAAIVARRLCLAQNGHMLVGHKIGKDDRVHEIGMTQCTNDYERFGELGFSRMDMSSIIDHPLVGECDVIHLHNLHGGYFNPTALIDLSKRKPIVWTLHDMTAITGHCAHSYDCEKWRTGCGNCQHLDTYPELSRDVSSDIWNVMRQVYRHCKRMHIVCPTEWLAAKVRQSILTTDADHPVHVIHNGVPTNIYQHNVKYACRVQMGIPTDKFIVGASALCGALQNRWKGGHDSIKVIEATGATYLNIGSGQSSRHPQVIDTQHVDSPELMSTLMCCLDAFLYPTYADNCPLSVLEALSCGVPIIGYAVGGMPEIVRSGHDGFLRPVGDIKGLCGDVRELQSCPGMRDTLGRNARKRMVERFDHALKLAEYAGVYRLAVQTY